MRIGVVTPAPPRSRYGNRVTAIRWAHILRDLGHSVSVGQKYQGEGWDALVALHARRSYSSISEFHSEHPDLPIIVALTGTDFYHDLSRDPKVERSLELASRIVALQPKALDELPARFRAKTRVIFQSLNGSRLKHGSSQTRTFDVCVIGHLRPVKDPFRAAMAARLLPRSSRIRVLHVGGAMTEKAAARARSEQKLNARYRWLGELSAEGTRRILERSHLFVLSSRMEGGANSLGEAIVAGVPVLASRIPGSIGILGEDYSGYFGVGETRQLARLLTRAETDSSFLSRLKQECESLMKLFDPKLETASWKKLLGEIFETRSERKLT